MIEQDILNENFFVCETANEAWQHWFDRLKAMKLSDPSRDGQVVGEVINAITVIKDPTRNFITSPDRKLPIRYAVGELLWYLSGSDSVKSISRFSEVWNNLSDDGNTANSAYGYRIRHKFGFDQWEYVKKKLIEDPMTRQAVIHIKDASNQKTKDTPCTVALQFLFRDGALHMTVYMRSNDIWTGFTYDVFAFTSMLILMAFELGVEIGTYTHIAGSLHLYERNLKEE